MSAILRVEIFVKVVFFSGLVYCFNSPKNTYGATNSCTDINSRIFHINGNWIVLGDRWIWQGNEAVNLLDPDLPKRAFNAIKENGESESLTWKQFEKEFKAKDPVFMANLGNMELAKRLKGRPFLGFKDGRWLFVNFKKEVVCKTQPLECDRVGKASLVVSSEEKKAVLREFKIRFEESQVQVLCDDYRKGNDSVFKNYDKTVFHCTKESSKNSPPYWKTFNEFCTSVSKAVSELNP